MQTSSLFNDFQEQFCRGLSSSLANPIYLPHGDLFLGANTAQLATLVIPDKNECQNCGNPTVVWSLAVVLRYVFLE